MSIDKEILDVLEQVLVNGREPHEAMLGMMLKMDIKHLRKFAIDGCVSAPIAFPKDITNADEPFVAVSYVVIEPGSVSPEKRQMIIDCLKVAQATVNQIVSAEMGQIPVTHSETTHIDLN